jgi:hypothetical protein
MMKDIKIYEDDEERRMKGMMIVEGQKYQDDGFGDETKPNCEPIKFCQICCSTPTKY